MAKNKNKNRLTIKTEDIVIALLMLLVFYASWESVKQWIANDLTTILTMNAQSTYALIAIIALILLVFFKRVKVN